LRRRSARIAGQASVRAGAGFRRKDEEDQVFARKLGRISRDTFHQCLLQRGPRAGEKDRRTAQQLGLHLRKLRGSWTS